LRKSVMMIFIVGLIMLVGGIVLAIASPATVTWKPKSEVLASEKALAVSAGWASKSESLIDKVITVDFYETYDYWFGFKPFIYGEAKDFVISGTATEQSSLNCGSTFMCLIVPTSSCGRQVHPIRHTMKWKV